MYKHIYSKFTVDVVVLSSLCDVQFKCTDPNNNYSGLILFACTPQKTKQNTAQQTKHDKKQNNTMTPPSQKKQNKLNNKTRHNKKHSTTRNKTQHSKKTTQ